MKGGRPTGTNVSNRIRMEIVLAGLWLLLLVHATSQAALISLFDPLSQYLPAVESASGLATESLIDPQPVEMVDETLEPAIDVVDDTVLQIDEFVRPYVNPPPVDIPEVFDPPLSEVVGGEHFTLESNGPVVEGPAGLASDVTIDVSGGPGTVVRGTKQKESNAFEQSLLSTDPAGSFAMINRKSLPVDTGWLSRLTAWLPPMLAGLVDVLAAPVKVLWLLLRALVSSGKWLIAPASLLIVLAFMMFVDRNSPSISSMRRELANATSLEASPTPNTDRGV
jgi:hypothetical protein